MDNSESILNELAKQIYEQLPPIRQELQDINNKLHQSYNNIESHIKEFLDQQLQQNSQLITMMQKTDQIYIESQKLEFLMKQYIMISNRIMQQIYNKIKYKNLTQIDLNEYLTYLKHMIIQYYNNSQLDNINLRIQHYYRNTSFLRIGKNKLDFFTTNNKGYYFLNNFLFLKEIPENHFFHNLAQNYFDLPIYDDDSKDISEGHSTNYSSSLDQLVEDDVVII